MVLQSKPVTQEAFVKPSIINVIPYSEYRKTLPRILGTSNNGRTIPADEDLVILYGGGRNFNLSVMTGWEGQLIKHVEIFILNRCLVIWFNDLNKGLEISYTNVLYHGCNKINSNECRDGLKVELLITIERDSLLDIVFPSPDRNANVDEGNSGGNLNSLRTVELRFRPEYSMYDRFYSNELESLFTFHRFGINRGDDMVTSCNDALAACFELNGNEFIAGDDDDQYINGIGNEFNDNNKIAYDENGNVNNQEAEYVSFNDTINTYHNQGNADDLGNEPMSFDNIDTGIDSGMAMSFASNNQSNVGQKRMNQV